MNLGKKMDKAMSWLKLNYKPKTLITTWCSETCYLGITSVCCTKKSPSARRSDTHEKNASMERCSSKQAAQGPKGWAAQVTSLDVTGKGTSEEETSSHQEQRRWRAPPVGYWGQKLYCLLKAGVISNPRGALLLSSSAVPGKKKVDRVEQDW